MERTIYHDGLEIGQEHLNFTERTKIDGIKRIITLSGTTGIIEGLIVAPDPGNPHRVMISRGSGWSFGGEFVHLASNVSGLVISNLIGVENYIVIEVREHEELRLPHVVTGAVHPTRITHRYVPLVLSRAEWVARVDKSMLLLAAVVIGSGGIVRGMDVRRPIASVVTLLAVERQPAALSGVTVKVVSSNTTVGVGALQWDFATRRIFWRPPGAAAFGAGVTIGITGEYRLWNQFGTTFIVVRVDVTRLPGENVTENVVIVNILEQYELSIGTMKDTLHRGMLGSGMPSIVNPHGLTLDDLDPGVHQNMRMHILSEHSPGIVGSPGGISASVSITAANQLRIAPITPGEVVISGGRKYEQLGNLFVTVSGTAGMYHVWVDEGGVVLATIASPREDYFLLATVRWDGVRLSDLLDRRSWGSVDPRALVQMDDAHFEFDPALPGRTLADSLGMIRWVLRRVIGGVSWTALPAQNINRIAEQVTSALDQIRAHVNASYTVVGTRIHGVLMGHQGGFDADMVDGRHFDNILVEARSGLEATLREGGFLRQISIISMDWHDSALHVVGNRTLQVQVGGQMWFLPARDAPCTCTCVCMCTCPCLGPCAPCPCMSQCTICHLKI